MIVPLWSWKMLRVYIFLHTHNLPYFLYQYYITRVLFLTNQLNDKSVYTYKREESLCFFSLYTILQFTWEPVVFVRSVLVFIGSHELKYYIGS